MSDQPSGSDQRFLPSGPTKKRANPSSGWVVMILAGLLAAIIFFYASIQGQQTYMVMAVGEPVTTGQEVNAASLRQVEVNLPKPALDRLVRETEAQLFDGWIATGPLEPGDLLNKSALRAPGAPNDMRAMSIPREQSHVVGGAVRVGDRVDLISQTAPANFIAADLEVIAVNGGGGGGALSGGLGDFSITVAVTPAQAVALAGALAESKFDVVRATGARPLTEYGIEFSDSPVATIPPDTSARATSAAA